ncbi:glycosyl hydrolase family 18 protein [Mucilaginibacter sp.]|uniref:glycosyl hydrolase family 18 protein n=1 Tax=Mucilaginibacter sp. TaxID=1882438 RepID=UPI0035BBFE07
MSKLRYLLTVILLLPIAQGVMAQSGSKFRVVGYIRNQRRVATTIRNFDLDKVTHLNIAFVNPDSAGNLPVTPGLKEITAIAHQKGVKVLLSIGGGTPRKSLPGCIYGDKQDEFIARLTKLTVDYDVDGIDVDLEGGLIDKNYEGFVVKLATALKAKKKMITAAIATVYADKYTDKALAQFDFINVMCYDKTGPWNPDRPGQHAPYDMAADDMAYWNNKRGIAKQRLTLGVPFYGYGFGANAPESMAYQQIIDQYPGAEKLDEVNVAGGGVIYYNGAITIKAKTKLALKTAGGVMIWQLLQDAKGDQSLLGLINRTIREAVK